MLFALATTTALAGGVIAIDKNGLAPTWGGIDGGPVGKVKGGKVPMSWPAAVGTHEVWLAWDEVGTVTQCHGLVDVAEGGTTTVVAKMLKCEGLKVGLPNGATAFKGARVSFLLDSAVDAWVSVDGGQALALPAVPFELNLAPGQHTIVLYTDVQQTSVFAQGVVTLDKGQEQRVQCTPGGCLGFDQPPIVILGWESVPAIQINIGR